MMKLYLNVQHLRKLYLHISIFMGLVPDDRVALQTRIRYFFRAAKEIGLKYFKYLRYDV